MNEQDAEGFAKRARTVKDDPLDLAVIAPVKKSRTAVTPVKAGGVNSAELQYDEDGQLTSSSKALYCKNLGRAQPHGDLSFKVRANHALRLSKQALRYFAVKRDCHACMKPVRSSLSRRQRRSFLGMSRLHLSYRTPQMIVNDGTEDMVVQLTHVKNIFAKQLPKMPKEYICRLVFDDRHKTLVLCRGAVPIGGICFREFSDRGILEIAFCAVAAEQQVQGHGTRLMSHLKQYAVSANITHFFTFADNYATGYFKETGLQQRDQPTRRAMARICQGLRWRHPHAVLCALQHTFHAAAASVGLPAGLRHAPVSALCLSVSTVCKTLGEFA